MSLPTLRKAVLGPAGLIGLVLLVVLAGSFSDALRPLDEGLRSLATRLVPDMRPGVPVTLIEIHDSAQALDRARLARAVERLDAMGAAAIGLHLPLDHPHTPPRLEPWLGQARNALGPEMAESWRHELDTDDRLAQALTGHGRSVLAAPLAMGAGTASVPHPDALLNVDRSARAWYDWGVFRPLFRPAEPPGRDLAVHWPTRALATAGLPAATATPDRPRPLAPGIVPVEEGYLAGFAVPLAAAVRGVAVDDIIVEPGRGLRLGETRITLGPDRSLGVIPPRHDPRGRQVEVHRLDTLMAGDLGNSQIQGRAVILGMAEGAGQPLMSHAGLTLPQATWSAWATAALVEGHRVATGGWFHGAERLLILLAALYLLWLPARLHLSTTGLLISGVTVFVLLNLSIGLVLLLQWWLPVVLPALVIALGHPLLALRCWLLDRLEGDRREASEAWLQLGIGQQGQGHLEPAFDAYRHCRLDSDTLFAQLYQLGRDFERRRQYGRAVEVFRFLQSRHSDFRDTTQRLERLKPFVGSRQPRLGEMQRMGGGRELAVDDDSLEKPMIGRYNVERQLGRGSMGIVYLGVDPHIQRKVAIKTLALNREFEPELLEQAKWRFFREAEASGRLNHRNIVTVYDVGEEHDLAFIAMDYLQGVPLDQFTQPLTLLPITEVLEVCAQVADALDYAHQQEVIHRDIKPANVIYDQGKGLVKITDFGIASVTDHNKTRTGTILGTPAFMSPEQVAGKPVDSRTDLFSLGVMLYQMLSGQLPFTADTMAGLVYQITQTHPAEITDLRPELGPLVGVIVTKSLQKDPAKRYQTGGEMARALRGCIEAFRRMPRPGQFSGSASDYYHDH
ncbi:protein kinase domain-containing protein [Ectothiorhodospira variabilis]|uniref:protein kinase domain-containing protein n=1 Tax=Ectothiorhodospira variabilis TaxID=505694 RepID=UPI001EFB981D|nr:protein kinase [Ectothiorhodospira variabilis]MCG5497588.1 protein kinase [Ectothiorhodospira variabilis]